MRKVLLLASGWLLMFTAQMQGQNCGCEAEGNCPVNIPPNSNTTVCYTISDAFNNDLANPNQGVCGVYVRFRHGRVGNLSMTLTSPAGTQVTLVDASGTCNTWTPVAVWDILFVPCGQTCDPDTVNNCPYPCEFDACPDDCPWANATYTGHYHPFSGCLENFNTGPVNGQWCLQINNDAMFNGGEIFDFEVILCDQSGFFCCDADAGKLNLEPDVVACEGDSSLQLTPNPRFGPLLPPDSLYGYTYTIFHNDTLIQYDSLTDLRTYMPGTYEVCGLSFLWADSTNLPATGSPLTPDSLFANLKGPSPFFCGDIDTNCIIVTISAPIPPVFLNETICQGDTVFVGSQAFTQSGTYSDTLFSSGGCDSIVNLALTVLPSDTVQLTDTLCSGSVLVVGNDTLSATGMYEVSLQNQFGCDSLVMVDLYVVEPDTTYLIDTLCGGDTLYIGSTPYYETGIFTQVLTSYLGCDSVVLLDLTVIDIVLDVYPSDILTCSVTEVSIDAEVVATTGSPTYTWSTNNGHITGPTTGPSTTVDAPGTYMVEVQVAECNITSSVTVNRNVIPPSALALFNGPGVISCLIDSVTMDGSNSAGQGNLGFEWHSQNGTLPSPVPVPVITVGDPDTFYLVVIDSLNGCTDTTSLVVGIDTLKPVANAGADDSLTCSTTTLALDGSANTYSGPPLFYWEALSGNLLPPVNVPNPQVDAPGTYRLIVTDSINGCQDSDLVMIHLDTVAPVPVLAFPDGNTLTCALDTLDVDASASGGSQLQFQWSGPLVAGQGTPLASFHQPGSYTLTLTDGHNGCTSEAFFDIDVDTVAPVADAGPPGSVSCTVLSVVIGGNSTSQGPGISYQWTSSPGGSFVGPTNERFATVNQPATYYLTVSDQSNGCTAIDSTVVSNNANPPVANAGPDQFIDCEHPSVVLDGSNSTIVPFTQIQWTDTSGQLIGNTIQVSVNVPGTYVLTLTFAFCSDSDTVEVIASEIPPIADAGPDTELDCLTGQALLDGSGSSAGPGIAVFWSSPDGGVVLGANNHQATAEGPGTYILSVTDLNNNCTSRDTALVTLDTAACMPMADAGADGLVNCYHLWDTLQANAPTGPPFSHTWTALAGTVANQTNPLAPVVSSGIFVFTVTNTAVGLSATDTVTVAADTVHPVASAHPATFLNLTCPELQSCYALDPTGTSTGPQYIYSWESSDGNFCTPTDQLQVEVMGTGIYNLRVTDTTNGCFAEDAVLVQLKDFPPLADAGDDLQMACGDSIATLDGSGSSIGNNYLYTWFSNGGTILTGANTLTPQVAVNNPSDTFYLEVLNTFNECRDTSSVVVFAPTGCYPTCMATASGPLTCIDTMVMVSGQGSTVSPLTSYEWSSASGTFCGPTNGLSACVSAPGTYVLTVTNTFNGVPFSTSCQVQVQADREFPVADGNGPRFLTCADSTLLLGGPGTSTGPEYRYLWMANPGSILDGQNQPQALVNAPGFYTLVVTDTTNGCTAEALVQVEYDTLHPVASISPADTLTCSTPTVVLDGASSPSNALFFWQTNEGDICGDSSQPSVPVCAPGTYLLRVTLASNGCTDTASVTVFANDDFPVVNAGPDLVYTCTDTVFVLQATANAANPLDYHWTASNGGCIEGPVDVLQPTVACPGVYTLTATDQQNGCTASSSMVVLSDTISPMAHAGSDQKIDCQTPVVTLDGSASAPPNQLAYSWTLVTGGHFVGPTDQPIAQADSAGIYLLTVTNVVNGCTDADTVEVILSNEIPIASAGPDTSLTCERTSLLLDGSASSVGTHIIYAWDAQPGHIVSGANSPTPLIDEPGVYVLTLSDTISNCTVSDTTVVTVDTLSPQAAILFPLDTVTCADPVVVIDGSASQPASSISFDWQVINGQIVGPTDQPTVQISMGGTYVLTVKNLVNGCTDEQAFEVVEDTHSPQVQFAPAPKVNCKNTQVQPEVLPPGPSFIYTYSWSGPALIDDADTRMPTVAAGGLYTVMVTDTTNGCTSTGSIFIDEDFSEPKAVASSMGALDCSHTQVTLTAAGSTTAGVVFQWTTSGPGTIGTPTQPNTSVNAPGWYYLTVTYLENGCSAIDSVEVVSLEDPIRGIALSIEDPDCLFQEGSFQIDSVFGGHGPFTFILGQGPPTTTARFEYLDPGSYQLHIEDPNGCQFDTTIFLPYPEEISVELGPDHHIRLGEAVTIIAQLSIPLDQVDTLWWTGLGDSASCPSCLEQLVAPLETTVYRIYVIDENGCRAEDLVTVWVDKTAPVYVPTAFSPNGDGLNDRFVLYAGEEVEEVEVFRIFDRWGDQVFIAEHFLPNDPANGWDGSFDGRPLDPAVFVWMARVRYRDGRQAILHGEVTLLR